MPKMDNVSLRTSDAGDLIQRIGLDFHPAAISTAAPIGRNHRNLGMIGSGIAVLDEEVIIDAIAVDQQLAFSRTDATGLVEPRFNLKRAYLHTQFDESICPIDKRPLETKSHCRKTQLFDIVVIIYDPTTCPQSEADYWDDPNQIMVDIQITFQNIGTTKTTNASEHG